MHLRRGGRSVERIDDGVQADKRVLEHLAELGCDPASPLEISHYLYLPDLPGAGAVADVLARDGWTTRTEPCEDTSWLVVASRRRALTPEGVRDTRRTLAALASEHGGLYDGWEARAG